MQKLTHTLNAISGKRNAVLLNQALRGVYNSLSTRIFTSTALVIGGTNTKVKIAAATHGIINGVLMTKAITDNAFTLSGSVTNAYFNVFCLYLDSAGTATAVMGAECATLSAVKFPPKPESKVMIGFVVINPTGTGDFVGGTTPLAGATVVPNAVYVNTVGGFDPTAVI